MDSSIEMNGDAIAPLLMTAKQLAKLLDVSMRSIWRMRSSGQLPLAVRLGGAVRWRVDEIKNWIARGCPFTNSREN
jgi:excisionase family DNA binding protein